MSEPWQSSDAPLEHRIGAGGWIRVVLRALPLIVLVFGGLLILLALRLFERPLCGLHRPVTPHITQFVCRTAFFILGMRYHCIGAPMRGAGAMVANHVSWLDIFALNARKRIYFVAKSEVAGWPGIGWLARATGTVFIRRDRSEVASQIRTFKDRLAAGHRLLFFPEGTSTDGLQVLPFKPALFAAFFDPALVAGLQMQAVTLHYEAPEGADPRFYGWWGDMEFAPHLLSTLAARRQGSVTVIYHTSVTVADFADRKSLARAMEDQVRGGLAQHRAA
ncbi:MAG: lysophospholipid acyltransferase family protein [Yoonia sp.]|uniref:lysophospholipid acyltransferase family protein n=1 Tax=Yoonia sp. TaxID=2212373 RepID=UPI003EF2728F